MSERPVAGRADVEGQKKDRKAQIAKILARLRFRDRVEDAGYTALTERARLQGRKA